MRFMRRALFVLAASLTVAGTVYAQTPVPPTRVRGTIDTVGANAITVTTRAGAKTMLKLADRLQIAQIAPIAVSAIKPGAFIGTAAVTQPDGTLKALEIQVFPESMRGVGEGHRPWDLMPDSTMTNGTVGDLKVENGRYLTLTYKGGEQKVYVPPDAPVITYLPGSRAMLQQGAHVIIFASKDADNSLTATRIGVGKDGLVPPM